MKQPDILIIDLGSQYTLIIEKTLQKLGFRSAILPPKKAELWLKKNKPKAILLSGGKFSIFDKGAPRIGKKILSMGIPILSICYGMQLITDMLGGTVSYHREKREYGKAFATFNDRDKLFPGLKGESVVWASHGDSVTKIPKGFKKIATSGNTIAAMSSLRRKIWGVQFHPEVVQTKNGRKILQNFVSGICGCKPDWKAKNLIGDVRENIIKDIFGKRGLTRKNITVKKAVVAFSGGVDSVTVSKIASNIPYLDVTGVCIDFGNLRKDEVKEIKLHAEHAGIPLIVIRASGRMQKALKGAIHSETKRRRCSKLYGKILDEVAKKIGAEFLIQGSLAPDFIETGAAGKSAKIKSHHNIGLITKTKQLHPFRSLFKYEVRVLARILGLPKSVTERKPFPGPGLLLRVIGKPATPKKMAIVRWATAKVDMIMKKHRIYNKTSQDVVALMCMPIVGIKGDGRSYKYPILVRGVITPDFMTAIGYHFPKKVMEEICDVLSKHPEIVGALPDPNNKPPRTVEFQ